MGFRMDENAVYWIRKFNSELSQNEPHLWSSSLSLRDSAFLIAGHLSKAVQFLVPRPRWHQDDIRLSICWAKLYATVLWRCKEKRAMRMEVLIATRSKATSETEEENLPSAYLELLELPDVSESAEHSRVKEIFKIAMGKIALHEEFMDTEQRMGAARAVCSMYDVLIDFGVRVHATTTYIKMCKMVKRKLDIWERIAKRAEQEQDVDQRRSVHFELGRCRLEMLDFKMKLFERSAGNLDAKLLQKMCYYCDSGIEDLKAYEQTIMQRGQDLGSLEKDKIVLLARGWFYTAKLYNKFFTPDRKEQMRYSNMAICYYTRVMDAVQRVDGGEGAMDVEIRELARISAETSDLLRRQVKMQEIEEDSK